jgi:hypothetical protein
MDIFAHGLWTAAAATGANRKLHTKIRAGWAAFWGVFPDLFAFTLPFCVLVWQKISGPAQAGPRHIPHLPLAWQLYQISHSLVTFSAVFGIVWLIARRPVLELLGWPLHILIDMPTHSARFFPTPFLWPVSSYRVSGISWANPWFMLVNYSALATVYFLLWRNRQRLRAKQSPDHVSSTAQIL